LPDDALERVEDVAVAPPWPAPAEPDLVFDRRCFFVLCGFIPPRELWLEDASFDAPTDNPVRPLL
jgi:hypothetical protein